ncbi:transcriptional regulatory protein HypF [Campylobacter insulaenigrae]|nr:transcriptional regulatory protein HypF [Campylobacter insulaenigrae]
MFHFGYEICIKGLVQGVGFRPFVYNLAKRLRLYGEVYNDGLGVVIRLQCEEFLFETFKDQLLKQLPKLARIDQIQISKTSFKHKYQDFFISSSKDTDKFSPILSDFSLCDDCQKEFYDKKILAIDILLSLVLIVVLDFLSLKSFLMIETIPLWIILACVLFARVNIKILQIDAFMPNPYLVLDAKSLSF